MSDQITITLSRADAAELFDAVKWWIDDWRVTELDDAPASLISLRDDLEAALATAPAEGPERAATGETLE